MKKLRILSRKKKINPQDKLKLMREYFKKYKLMDPNRDKCLTV